MSFWKLLCTKIDDVVIFWTCRKTYSSFFPLSVISVSVALFSTLPLCKLLFSFLETKLSRIMNVKMILLIAVSNIPLLETYKVNYLCEMGSFSLTGS